MRVRMHISEVMCELCRKEYLTELLELANKDDDPVRENGCNCVICGNPTNDYIGHKVETSEPIELIKKCEETFARVQIIHKNRMHGLILKIREAKLKGESHIKITDEEKKE